MALSFSCSFTSFPRHQGLFSFSFSFFVFIVSFILCLTSLCFEFKWERILRATNALIMLETLSKRLRFLLLRPLRLNLSERETGSSSFVVQVSRYLSTQPPNPVSVWARASNWWFFCICRQIKTMNVTKFPLSTGCCWYQESIPGLHACWRWKLCKTRILLWACPPTICLLELAYQTVNLNFAVDCIDCAADGAVVSAVNDGIEAAKKIAGLRRPWVMVSVNDDEDLHFRKAGIHSSLLWFD